MSNKYVNGLKVLNKNIAQLSKKYGMWKAYFWLDALHGYIFYGITPTEYYGFEWYNLSGLCKRSFYTARHAKRMEKVLNNKNYLKYFEDKKKFNSIFSDFVNRDWLDVLEATKEEFDSFIQCHEKVLVKARNLSSGRGIQLYNNETYEELVEKQALLEEYVKQHVELQVMNESSVNTVRVFTILDKKNDVHVLSATLRVGGKGCVVDNAFVGGRMYPLDISNGKIIGKARQKKVFVDKECDEYDLVGFELPNWSRLLEFVSDAALVMPQIRLVGWDVAILDNSFEMIEGNHNGNPNIMQQHKGLLKEIRELM